MSRSSVMRDQDQTAWERGGAERWACRCRVARGMRRLEHFAVQDSRGIMPLRGLSMVRVKVKALPWRPSYAPRVGGRYVLGAAPEVLEQVTIGDELVFEDCPD